jgi:hypothetical protein
MREQARAEPKLNGWSISASALLHIILCIGVLLMPTPSQMSVPQEESVNVEIVSLPAKALKERRELSLPPPSHQIPNMEEPVAPQEPNPQNPTPAFVKPRQMLSDAVLADPRSSQARQALAQLTPADQVEQLCNLEAMAQVGAWSTELQPDRVVAYAMADAKLSGTTFVAEGAAVHSKRDWYELQFKCELTQDHKTVAAFEFLMGAAIPKETWLEHNLPDEDGASD